jgi:hypothetical protein
MNYAVEMKSGAMICIPGFIKIGSNIQNVLREIHIQTHRQQYDHISLLLFFSK